MLAKKFLHSVFYAQFDFYQGDLFMKSKNILKFSGGLVLTAALSTFAVAQDTTQKTTTTTTTTRTDVVQNADGSYTVIEYPVGKEVSVELTPSMSGARGMARVMRMADGTKVYLDINGVTGDTRSFYAYAVDPSGMPTLLGPVMVENGLAKAEFTTPMNQFMLVLSPTQGLTAIDPATPVVFRSSVPKGFAVVANRPTTALSDEKQVANSQTVASTYEVPLLGVSTFEKGETEIRVNFSGELQGLKGKAYIDNSKQGVTKIKMRFDDMKLAPKQKRYVLWAVSPAKEYTKIGQIINAGNRQESEIRGETALADFGLFVTVEDTDVLQPTGTIYAPLGRL
ncbi:MAG: hypothetical protein JWN60_2589 [Acidobacteria bacterium]|jgi:hypothetical protein|nr:hypothetical protein [Acidobacteriota bacterium]